MINPLRTEVYFCHQNQNAKNIGKFTTLLKPHNIGTHLKGIETSFQVVPLFLKSFLFWASYIYNFLIFSLFEIFSKYLRSLNGVNNVKIIKLFFLEYFQWRKNFTVYIIWIFSE
jgi:hypothetical protein